MIDEAGDGGIGGGVDPRAGAAGLRRDRRVVAPPVPAETSRRVAVAPPRPAPAPNESTATPAPVAVDSGNEPPTASPPAAATRDRATTVYLSGRIYQMLRMARARGGRSQVDIILDVVSAHYEEVRHGQEAPVEPVDPILGIARRSRRRVDDGRVVQLRFTADEKAALTRLAKEAEMTVSSMVAECLVAELGDVRAP